MSKTVVFVVAFVGIAVGCGIWLGFFRDVRSFDQSIKQDSRAAKEVGADPLPQAKIKIEIKDNKYSCVKIESVDLDYKGIFDRAGFVAMLRNSCQSSVSYTKLRWSQEAPDGTVINTGWNYAIDAPVEFGQRVEYRNDGYEYIDDPRVSKFKIWAQVDN